MPVLVRLSSVTAPMLSEVTPFFAGWSGAGVRIAVVDSGVHAAHPHVGGVSGGVAILADGREGDDFVDRIGHGTAVAAAIREKAPGADLFAVKIFDRSLATDAATLARAIDVAAARGAHLINLSLGTPKREHAERLREVVASAAARGAVIVSARDEGGTCWWPGSLDGVLAVTLDWECPRDEYRIDRPGAAPVFRASGYPRGIPGVPPERNLKGISFAVANMSGFAARALERYPGADLDRLVDVLAAACPGPAVGDPRN